MEILVCVRRVPDTSENEIELDSQGSDIAREELVYSLNEPDNYAVEEALQIRDRVGGTVTVVTVGGEDDEEILRRELAMGANRAVLLSDEVFADSDGRGIATILKDFVQKEKFDLILTGVQAEDGAAQVGVLSIQTGINEPRYVGMRGIRQVASIPIATLAAQDLLTNANSVGRKSAKVVRIDYFMPVQGQGAEILRGEREENAEKIAELIAARGGLR